MNLTRNSKIGLVVVLAVTVAITPIAVLSFPNQPPIDKSIKLTLLYNAGIMIEARGLRIYIDPITPPENYTDYPADAILITHDHGDHYNSSVIEMLQKDGTLNVFPKIMDDGITNHSGTGISPLDSFQIGIINITAFYMYTYAPFGFQSSHPIENNYTSYIIDIDGFTIFHAGDSKNITEYEQLTGTIDVALLPLGPGCQTMAGREVVDAIQKLQPKFFIPIHYVEGANDNFVTLNRALIETTTDCQIMNLGYSGSHTFELEEDDES